ncbi:MAG: aromatic ring-hydroxylating oxygenase subunit alpha [Hyphomicrobiaceae bacterium]
MRDDIHVNYDAMNNNESTKRNMPPADWDRRGLPAWSYLSDELLELEKEELFRRHWQLVCHVNDLPEPGQYIALDVVGERALIIRDRDGIVRAFHNVCRHRGSRVVADEKGQCKSAIVCPFHGWTYNLDGTLRGAAQPQTLPKLDPVEFGLPPLEMEIWRGFVFVRFKPGPQPSITQVLSRFDEEIAPYGLDDLLPAANRPWNDVSEVNWKSVRDVDNEGYHVPMAHPGLHELFGDNYYDEPFGDGTARSFSGFSDDPGQLWSVRAYKNILPKAHWLPESHQRAWLYIGAFPNFVFGLYPDSVIFYQEFPLSVGRTLLRSATYRRPDECRNLRAARYLSGRIDQITSDEDQMLTVWSCEAAQSSGYKGIILSDLEYGVRSYHDQLRSILPVLNEDTVEPGKVMARNAALKAESP